MNREQLLEALDAHVATVETIKRLAREPVSPALDAGIADGLRQSSEALKLLADRVAP